LSLTADWSAVGVGANDRFGVTVASAGDSNGDGYADLAVGAIGFNTNTGKVYIYRGSAGGLNLTANWSVLGEAPLDQFGRSVAPAGDVNGDGYPDLAVGADANNSATGKAYLFHGSAVTPGCITSCLRVIAIQMQVVSGVVKAIVTVRDEVGAAIPAAKVFARWDLPNGVTLNQSKKTNASGLATFIASRGAGAYTIRITNVTKAGYTFDPDNSTILSQSITK
jgi:hypothetical protein